MRENLDPGACYFPPAWIWFLVRKQEAVLVNYECSPLCNGGNLHTPQKKIRL